MGEILILQSTADGLRTNLSERTFGCITSCVDTIITVTEEEIALACLDVFERLKLVCVCVCVWRA